MAEDMDDIGMPSGGGLPPFVLPVATALMALVAGGALGALVVWGVRQPEVVEKIVPRDLTASELEAVCAPLVAEVAANLTAAEDKVTTLVTDVKAKEAKVQELEAEMKKRGQRGAALVKELEAAKAELEVVKSELRVAIEEKEKLVVELKQTLVKLEDQKSETRAAKEDSLQNKWTAFTNQAQLDICEKGNRKKLGRCRETVTEVMGVDLKTKFEHCIRAGQEVPALRATEKESELPQFSQFLDQESKITKDWYIMLCDPTLPEAAGFADDRAAASTGSSGGDGAGSLFDAEEPPND